jgi:hypothetical protein
MMPNSLESNKPLAVLISDARLLLETHYPSTTLENSIEILLTAANQTHVDSELREVSSFLRDAGLKSPIVSSLLLFYLPTLTEPRPFIDILPSVFGLSSAILIEELFDQLVLLTKQDNRYILPSICALCDLPLPTHLQPSLSKIAYDAMAVVDETDIPFLCRTILTNLPSADGFKSTLKLRKEV